MISALVPKSFKRKIRPLYYLVFFRNKLLASSVLEIGCFSGFQVAYRKGSADESVIEHSFEHDIYFSRVSEYKPADDHVIMDIGAHIGTFSLLAALKVPHGRVYAIEACKESYNLLRINNRLNNVNNIDVTHLALADRSGTCTLYHDLDNRGHTICRPITGFGEIVQSDTLTNYMETKGISKCHFIKLNCEGAEFPILLSTQANVLQRFGIILVLYHCDIASNYTEQKLVSHLHSSGFDTAIRYRTSERGWIIATNSTLKGAKGD